MDMRGNVTLIVLGEAPLESGVKVSLCGDSRHSSDSRTANTFHLSDHDKLPNVRGTQNDFMKKLLPALCLVAFITPLLDAQDLTSEERDRAVQYLEKTRDGVLVATKGLSEAQWNFKPATNRWSVAEVAEHIAAAEDLLIDMIQNQVMAAPARTNSEDVKALDAMVLQRIPDRTVKAKAPEPLQPNNRFGSPENSLKHFEESRTKTIQLLKETKDLRAHAADSPLGKQLDGYEWVLFIAAHSERHTKQIEEVKADPNFPKQ